LIPYLPISEWWCCLNPRERTSLAFCGGQFIANPTFMYQTTFDAFMAFTGESSNILMLDYFMSFYGLEYQLIPCGEDCVIEAVVFVGGFWPLLVAFMITDGFICDEPCKLLTFPQ